MLVTVLFLTFFALKNKTSSKDRSCKSIKWFWSCFFTGDSDLVKLIVYFCYYAGNLNPPMYVYNCTFCQDVLVDCFP